MVDMELQILILNGREQILGSLNPDIVDITETNQYGGIKTIEIVHPLYDGENDYDYDSLLTQGNKIWRNQTVDGEACLYILNSEKEKDIDTLTMTAEDVLVELNDCGVVESSSATPITINAAQLTTWFGNWFTIGTFETPIGKNTISFTGTLTRMMLLRLIEEETGNIFVTRYEYNPDTNIIHRYLDFKRSIGVEHLTPIEIGENTDKIEIATNEDDTFRSIVPIIKDSESSGATAATVKTSQVMADFKALAVDVGQSIPMIIEKQQTEMAAADPYTGNKLEKTVAVWNAPFKKDAGSWEVYLAAPYPASYNNIYNKEGSATLARKIGTVETSETNKYVIYNLCALKLMDKKDPHLSIEATVHDLQELPGGNLPYNCGDIVHIRLPNREGVITSRVEKTEKNPRETGSSKITIGNVVSAGTYTSRSDLSRPAGLDTPTLSKIYEQIAAVSSSIRGIADSRINSLFPGLIDTPIQLSSGGNWFSKHPNIATGSDYLQDTSGVQGQGATVTSSTDWAFEGSRSFKVVTNGSIPYECLVAPSTNMMPTQPGEKRYTSAWVKGSGTVYIQIDWRNSAGSRVGGVSGVATTLSSTPQLLSVSGTAPAGTVYATMKVATTTTQAITYYVDKIRLSDSEMTVVDEFNSSSSYTGKTTFNNGFMLEWGKTSITFTGAGTLSTSVSFTNEFAYPPMVLTQVYTGAPNIRMASASDITTTGCNIFGYSTGAITMNIGWLAVGKRKGY